MLRKFLSVKPIACSGIALGFFMAGMSQEALAQCVGSGTSTVTCTGAAGGATATVTTPTSTTSSYTPGTATINGTFTSGVIIQGGTDANTYSPAGAVTVTNNGGVSAGGLVFTTKGGNLIYSDSSGSILVNSAATGALYLSANQSTLAGAANGATLTATLNGKYQNSGNNDAITIVNANNGSTNVTYNSSATITSASGSNLIRNGINIQNTGSGTATLTASGNIGTGTTPTIGNTTTTNGVITAGAVTDIPQTSDITMSSGTTGTGKLAVVISGSPNFFTTGTGILVTANNTNVVSITGSSNGFIQAGTGISVTTAGLPGATTIDTSQNIIATGAYVAATGAGNGITVNNPGGANSVTIDTSTGGGYITSTNGYAVSVTQNNGANTSGVQVTVGSGKYWTGKIGGILINNSGSIAATPAQTPDTVTVNGILQTTAAPTSGVVALTSGYNANVTVGGSGSILADTAFIKTNGYSDGIAISQNSALNNTVQTITNNGTINGAISTNNANGNSLFTNNGTWTSGTVNSVVGGSILNSGTIDMRAGAAGAGQITVNNNWSGGGIVRMNANLGSGGGGAADLLIIGGNSSGASTVIALTDTSTSTTAPATGTIATLVSVGGANTATDFRLQAGGYLRGATIYTMSNTGGLYQITGTTNKFAQPFHNPNNLSTNTQSTLAITGDSVAQHLADIRDLNNGYFVTAVSNPPIPGYAGPTNSGWLSTISHFLNYRGASGNTAAGYSGGVVGLAGGFDFGGDMGDFGRQFYGINGAMTISKININDAFSSYVSTGGGTLGASGMWQAKSGMFADASLQGTFGPANVNISAQNAVPWVYGLGSTADFGWRFQQSNGFYFEPMATLVGSWTSYSNFTISGTTYSGSNFNLNTGAGVRFGSTTEDGAFSVTARAWYAPLSQNTTNAVTASTNTNLSDGAFFPGLYGEVSGKLSFFITRDDLLFLNAGVKTDLSNFDANGTVGYSHTW